MTQPISLYLIGGFLGAGKTTFIQRLLSRHHGGRLGLLVNEFGSIGVDGALLGGGEVKMVEINNGSIFCACLRDGFVRTLKAFSDQPIDTLLIEASGMADPASMSTILDRLSPYLSRQYEYRGLICLVDCTTFSDYVDLLLPVQNQVATADLILVNKTDLVLDGQVQETIQTIRNLNNEAVVYRTTYADLPWELLEQNLVSRRRDGQSSNTPWNRPATYSLEAAPLQTGQKAVQRFYERIAPYILRMKGFLETPEGPLHLDGVCGQLELSSASNPELCGKLVAIGRTQEPFNEVLYAAWEQELGTPVTIQET